jgi:hypothetical protein
MDSNMQLNTSGVLIIEMQILMDPVSDILKKTFAGGNLGFGLDLGLLITLKKHSNYSQYFDVGYIKHFKQVETWTYKGLYKYEGINPIFNDSNDPGTYIKNLMMPFSRLNIH